MSDIANPEYVGDSDKTPVVRLDSAAVGYFTDPANGGCAECGCINWFHATDCSKGDTNA